MSSVENYLNKQILSLLWYDTEENYFREDYKTLYANADAEVIIYVKCVFRV